MSNLIYLDACVIVSLLKRTPGRVDTIESVFSRVRSKKLDAKLFTSTLSVIEVAHLSSEKTSIDSSHFRIIDDFWKSAPITIVELNLAVARKGRRIMQERLLAHKSPELPDVKKRKHDIGHIGTAVWLGVDEFWTYDPDFPRYNVDTVRVCAPYTNQPTIPGLLK